MGVGGQRHASAALPPGKKTVPIVQEAGWAPGPVWTGAENLAYTGIRSPDRPARSESLYRMSYPGQRYNFLRHKISYCRHTCVVDKNLTDVDQFIKLLSRFIKVSLLFSNSFGRNNY
jgi:hypothetical protein